MGLREGRHSRPIYQIHKWFARRLGCVFRALLVSATTQSEQDFWRAYYGEGDLTGKSVLDLFVGGGTSIVEASRLGATVYGSDIDPIAALITQAELSAPKIPPLDEAMAKLVTSFGDDAARHYRTWDKDGNPLTVLHYFWVQQVKCRKCGITNDCHPNYFLGSEEKHNWVFCRSCGSVHRLKANADILSCPSCRTGTSIWDGPVDQGAITCQGCGTKESLIAASKRTRSTPKWKLFAIEALQDTKAAKSVPIKDRRFIKATRKDANQYKKATDELRRYLSRPGRPKVDFKIPKAKRFDKRLEGYGYKTWDALFNRRQLLHLYKLADEIRNLDDETRHWMSLAFSNHLTTNCMMTAYAGKWRRLTPIFSIRAFRHVPRPVEINPWLDGTGRGTFINAVRQIEAAQRYSKCPTEPPRHDSGEYVKVPPRQPEREATVRKCNAERLEHIRDCSIDMVLSDPPYYDNIEYSNLADFFAPWLEYLGLLKHATQRTAVRSKTLSAKRGDAAKASRFARRLGNAFREIERVLRPGGLAVFTYRHSTGEGWLALGKAISKSTLDARAVFPIPGEAGANMHVRGNSGRWDAVIVLEKTKVRGASRRKAGVLELANLNEAHIEAEAWTRRLRDTDGLPFTDADALNLKRALLLGSALGSHRQVRPKAEVAGRMPLGDALGTA
jgi:adenine-specific DNA methylase